MARVTHDIGFLASANPAEDFLRQAQSAVQSAVQQGTQAVAQGAQAVMAEGQKALEFAGRVTKDPVGALIGKLTVATAYTQPLVYTGPELAAQMNAKPNPKAPMLRLGTAIKPAFMLETPFGQFNYAPYGTPKKDEWVSNQNKLKLYAVGGVVALVGLGFVLGRWGTRR